MFSEAHAIFKSFNHKFESFRLENRVFTLGNVNLSKSRLLLVFTLKIPIWSDPVILHVLISARPEVTTKNYINLSLVPIS